MLALLAALLTALPCSSPGTAAPSQACPAAPQEDAATLVTRASAHMDAGAWREALALLAAPAAQEAGPAVRLLRGICHYELGEDTQAVPELQAARADAELSSSADLFLGLIAQRQGRSAEAAEAFAAVLARGAGGELGTAANTLLRRSQREGRLSLALSLGAGYDTNPLLAPPGAPRTSAPADGAGQGSVSLVLQPWGTTGPFARAGASGRRQLRLNTFDTAGAQAGAGWRLAQGAYTAGLELGWEGLLLGGAPFSDAQQLAVTAGWQPGATGLHAAYSLRSDAFHPRSASGYSGLRQVGALEIQQALGDLLLGRAGYTLGRAATAEPTLANLEHGPLLGLSAALGPGARLTLEGRVLHRSYPAASTRQDLQLTGTGALEVDVHPRWLLRAELVGLHVRSTMASQSFATLAGGVSLQHLTTLF